jgi:hypothetical protein
MRGAALLASARRLEMVCAAYHRFDGVAAHVGHAGIACAISMAVGLRPVLVAGHALDIRRILRLHEVPALVRRARSDWLSSFLRQDRCCCLAAQRFPCLGSGAGSVRGLARWDCAIAIGAEVSSARAVMLTAFIAGLQ